MRKKPFKWLKRGKQKFDLRRNPLTQGDEESRLAGVLAHELGGDGG